MKRYYIATMIGASIVTAGLAVSTITPPAAADLDSVAYTYMVTKPANQPNYSVSNNISWNLLGLQVLLIIAGIIGGSISSKLAKDELDTEPCPVESWELNQLQPSAKSSRYSQIKNQQQDKYIQNI